MNRRLPSFYEQSRDLIEEYHRIAHIYKQICARVYEPYDKHRLAIISGSTTLTKVNPVMVTSSTKGKLP